MKYIKYIITFFIAISFLQVNAGEDYSYEEKAYNKPTVGLDLWIDDGKFEWSKPSSTEFSYYKFVYSKDNKEPVYPNDETIFIGDNIEETSLEYYNDKFGYFRVCAVYEGYYALGNNSDYMTCSNVISIEGEVNNENSYEDETLYYKKNGEEKELVIGGVTHIDIKGQKEREGEYQLDFTIAGGCSINNTEDNYTDSSGEVLFYGDTVYIKYSEKITEDKYTLDTSCGRFAMQFNIDYSDETTTYDNQKKEKIKAALEKYNQNKTMVENLDVKNNSVNKIVKKKYIVGKTKEKLENIINNLDEEKLRIVQDRISLKVESIESSDMSEEKKEKYIGIFTEIDEMIEEKLNDTTEDIVDELFSF